MRRSAFTDMSTIVPAGKLGKAEVKHVVVDKAAASWTSLRAVVSGGRSASVQEGSYAQLFVNNYLVMSDTQMERRSNTGVVYNATGDVLIAGLGLGMILLPILAKDEVTSVTVIEQSGDVVSLVEPHIRQAAGKAAEKLAIIEADIFEWKPPKGQKWDTIYFDIWADICTDSLDDMSKLHRKFARRKTSKEAWMDSWKKAELQYRRQQERRQERMFRW